MAGTFKVTITIEDEATGSTVTYSTRVRNDLFQNAYPTTDTKQNWAQQSILKTFVDAYRTLVRGE